MRDYATGFRSNRVESDLSFLFLFEPRSFPKTGLQFRDRAALERSLSGGNVIAGHSRSKNGVAPLAYDPAIHRS